MKSDADSGIDIAAQPPGKRLQNVLLLSGGEKALAALALLIAIFRYTPSPFCILDEVDAPLDESNIERFSRMVEQMSRHTQFILITHSKRTMEIARVMYGVTMEEPGVSKLVSVRSSQEKIGEWNEDWSEDNWNRRTEGRRNRSLDLELSQRALLASPPKEFPALGSVWPRLPGVPGGSDQAYDVARSGARRACSQMSMCSTSTRMGFTGFN